MGHMALESSGMAITLCSEQKTSGFQFNLHLRLVLISLNFSL